MTRSYAAEAQADFEALLSVATPILVDDHGLQVGEATRISDIVTELARSAPALAPDVRLLISLDQGQAATAAVSESLVVLRTLDPHLFDDIPHIKKLALLVWRACPNARDWQSLVHSQEDVDAKRRGWRVLCNRLIAEGRAGEIPTDADVAGLPEANVPGQGAISSSRSRVSLRPMPPEQDA